VNFSTFETLKTKLTTPPVLAFYSSEFYLYLYTDSSGKAVGSALLQQQEDNTKRPIAYMSKALNAAQQKYSTTEREFYAIYLSLKRFHPYLSGRKFTIYTDHKPIVGLKFATNTTKISNRLTMWALFLQEHDCNIIYQKGSTNKLADVLSRLPTNVIQESKFMTFETEFLQELQNQDSECHAIMLQIETTYRFRFKNNILVNVSLGYARPVIPKVLRTNIK